MWRWFQFVVLGIVHHVHWKTYKREMQRCLFRSSLRKIDYAYKMIGRSMCMSTTWTDLFLIGLRMKNQNMKHFGMKIKLERWCWFYRVRHYFFMSTKMMKWWCQKRTTPKDKILNLLCLVKKKVSDSDRWGQGW